jgi:NADH-quinone oxidoreductase subunit L
LNTEILNILATLIPGLPLIGFLSYLFIGDKISKHVAGILASIWVVISFVLSLILFLSINENSPALSINLFQWIELIHINIPFTFQIDQLSIIMMMLITGVGSLIHIYSIGYMHDDDGFKRFFAYLNLFIFFMLILVMANNYVLMFAGWEGVGLCSYLLIGFWHKNEEYNKAANKAFIINRIGDLFLLFGLFMTYQYFGTFEYESLKALVANGNVETSVITIITLLIFAGATGKSAQIPLFTWLPDAMAGPTPVSALIHAATMVTAGIYLIIRSNFLFVLAPFTNDVILTIGLLTAFMAGFIALKQNDIKKVLAYSTVSQLGLMFFALGLGAYAAAFFHVLTHAFFKALLFLGAGSVIHGLHGEQDIRKMGNVSRQMSTTHWTFLIGVLAIIALPPFAGFFSKDNILLMAFIKSPILWGIALGSGLLTVYYMLRLYFLVFKGDSRQTHEVASHAHESPHIMTWPLIILSILSIIGGWMNIPELMHGNRNLDHFISVITPLQTIHLDHSTEWMLIAVSVLGILIVSYFAYRKYIIQGAIPEPDDQIVSSNLGNILNKKFYIDELYDAIIVRPIDAVSSFLSNIFDKNIIQNLTDSTAAWTLAASEEFRKSQNGYISYYLFGMALGVLGILTIFIFLAI